MMPACMMANLRPLLYFQVSSITSVFISCFLVCILKRALHDYFDLSDDNDPEPTTQPSSVDLVSSNSSSASCKSFVDPEPDRIRVLSWNIDGLDQNNVATRAKSVCITINQ